MRPPGGTAEPCGGSCLRRFVHTKNTKAPGSMNPGLRDQILGRRPTLPPGFPGSTIGAGGLNFSVRNGKRCGPSAIATPIYYDNRNMRRG